MKKTISYFHSLHAQIGLYMAFTAFVLQASEGKAQDPCSYNSSIKKGGHWVFSTYYQPNTTIPLEGVCEQKNGTKPQIYREFKKGRLVKTVIYSSENKLQSHLETFSGKRDSVIAELKSYYQNGELQLHEIYYLNKDKRRCAFSKTYGSKGKLRFEQSYAWVLASELTIYQKDKHPPHTIDEDGYTYLSVPFGKERIFDDWGYLTEERHHRLLVDGSHEFGSLNGPALKYYDNGKLKVESSYLYGKQNGVFVEYDYLGQRLTEGLYDQGLKAGIWNYYYANGALKARHTYNTKGKHPFRAQKEEWSESGKLMLKYDFNDNGEAWLKEWNESGLLIHEQELYDFELTHGVERFWFPSGQLKSCMNHKSNADTLYIEYYASGKQAKLKRKYMLGNDSVTEIKDWYENGKLKETLVLKKSEFAQNYTQIKYYENGNLRFQDVRKNKERFVEDYASNGIKIRSKQFIDGKINGKFQELDSTGRLRLSIDYENGLRNGDYLKYDENGKILYAAKYKAGEWIPSNGQKSFLTAYKQLNTNASKIYVSAAYLYLNRFMNAGEPLRHSFAYVDTLAAVIWKMHELVPAYPEWISVGEVKNQVLNIRLNESYFRDLKTNNVQSEFSKELLNGLAALGVSLPKFDFVYGEAAVNIELKEWINMATLKKIFPTINNMMFLMNPRPEQKVNHKYASTIRCEIERLNQNCWKLRLPNEEGLFYLVLYGDGTAEVQNQELTWDEFLKISFQRNPYHDAWLFND